MLFDILTTFLLILLNGFFVAAEFSLVKVRGSQLDLKIQKGSKRAKLAKYITEHLDQYLSASQLGITLSSLALGAIGETVVSQIVEAVFIKMNFHPNGVAVHGISLPIALFFLTYFHVTIGEQIPKMIGIRYSLPVSMMAAWPIRIFFFVFNPFIWLLSRTSMTLLRLAGIKSISEEVHTEEELRLILTESEEGGAIKPSENELIQNVFDFDDRFVKQIMVPQNRVVAIDAELGKNEVAKLVIDEGFSRIPLYLGDIDHVIGIVHSKDLLKALINNSFRSLKEIMRPAHFVPESMKIMDLLRDFQKHHIQMAIVTNEFGATAGIITMEDIIEELVGEIQDEHDEEKPLVEKKSDTEFIVSALATINDVNESLPIALPSDSHYETISGYINYIFGRIPAVNDKRVRDGYEFTIMKRSRQNVDTVRMKVMEP